MPAERDGREARRRLPRDRVVRLLSYNIQTGLAATHFGHYFTRGLRYVTPHHDRQRNLQVIAEHLRHFDLVALQEVDAGSLRTGFASQTESLAHMGGFPFWAEQANRRVGRIARPGNGLLSRVRPQEVVDHKLPGLPGRGTLEARFTLDGESLSVFVIHLALGRRGRERQIHFLSDLVRGATHAIVMGDLNCRASSREVTTLRDATGLRVPYAPVRTFPSWRPRRDIDHILVSDSIEVSRTFVPQWTCSDHLPLAMEVRLPPAVTGERGARADPTAAGRGDHR